MTMENHESINISMESTDSQSTDSQSNRRWIPNPGVSWSKPLGGSKVDSVFHPSEVDKMSTRNFWELSGKK